MAHANSEWIVQLHFAFQDHKDQGQSHVKKTERDLPFQTLKEQGSSRNSVGYREHMINESQALFSF